MEFRRSYNSLYASDGGLGYGWTHNYNLLLQVIQTQPFKRLIIWDSDGRALYFTQVQQTSTEILFGGESGVKDRLKKAISTGEYYFERKQGNLIYYFDSNGKLLTISDPNGNTLTMTYTNGVLTQVSNNFGKSLSIQYTNGRISSVTDPKNQSVSYAYTNGDLTQVAYPEQNSVSYAYDSNHNLTDKYDTNSSLIGHWEYDNRHRVTNYYSHVRDSAHQDEINLVYSSGSTDATNSVGTTTYTTAVIDGIYVVQDIEGCTSCGGENKSLAYTNRLDLSEITVTDGTTDYTTQYTYDNPTNWWEQLGEVQQKTEAVGLTGQRTTSYSYTHDTNDPTVVRQRVETKVSVVDSNQNRTSTSNYDASGNLTSRVESGYVLVDGVPTMMVSLSKDGSVPHRDTDPLIGF